MRLSEQISSDLKTAMKEKSTEKLSLLRVLKSEIQRSEQTSKGKIELDDVNVINIIKKLIQSIKETTNNEIELSILNNYLPQQLSETEIISILELLSIKNFGEIMKYFKNNYDGKYDGKILSSIIKGYLQTI